MFFSPLDSSSPQFPLLWCSAPKCIDAHATKYFFRNNKLLRNLEKEEDKGKEDFLHKYHIIMKYKIAQGWVWQKNEN